MGHEDQFPPSGLSARCRLGYGLCGSAARQPLGDSRLTPSDPAHR
jgi:hypothetical protein